MTENGFDNIEGFSIAPENRGQFLHRLDIRVTAVEARAENHATQGDIARLEGTVKEGFAEMRGTMAAITPELKNWVLGRFIGGITTGISLLIATGLLLLGLRNCFGTSLPAPF